MFNSKLFYALTIYLSALFVTNTLGIKTMPFFFGTHLSVSIFFMPILFLTTDIVGQVYGREISKKFVIAGFIALVFFLLANILTELVPWSSQTYTRIGPAFDTVFSLSWRMSIASLLAFGIAEYIDVVVFFAAKRLFSNFFIASTLSNIVSQALDTALFMTIAFA